MLYKSEQSNLSDPSSFLDRIHLKQLSEDKREILSSEITEAEILQTIKTFSLKKPPGMDGFPIEFYSTFWSKLAPIFIQMTRHMSENQVLPKSMYQAIISVILKPGKSGESPADYRPISLINCDNKILSKLMSNRLSKILPDLIHKNQTGFIKNRRLQTNTRTCFGIIQHVKKHNLNLTVMAVDAEKAFDRLEWPFLFKVLQKFNFPGEFLNFVRLVYKFPKARIFTNSVLSEEFTLERGTRQGCPLSPLLFALAMEPLAERIRQDQQITGITIGEQYKLNLFADDLLMYLNNFDESIQPLLTIFNEYSMVSGYKINLGKTEVMAVGKSKNTVNTLRQAFKWTSKIKYLGCNINISKKQIYNDNYIPLLNSMQSEMNKWSNLPLNITGRINLFKINSSKISFSFFYSSCSPTKNFL